MNRLEAKKFLDILHPANELFEIRSVGKYTDSGYFTNIDKAIDEMEKHPKTTFYVTLNKINPACYGREQHDKILAMSDKQKKTTADNDIVEINNILIDFDAKRASGVSSSDEEKEFTRLKMRAAYRYLRNNGFEDMLVVDSGNGYHLIVRVSIGVKDLEVVKNFLLSMSAMFSDEHVDVDTTVFNPSRITKIAGVLTSKGANTEDRPHRESKIIYVPDEIKPTSVNYISKIASFVQQEVEAPSYRNNYQQFDIRDFIRKHGIDVERETVTNGITKFVLSQCPFDGNHKAPDAAIFQFANGGGIAFKCFHNSCAGNGWKELRLKYEPTAYDGKYFKNITSASVPNSTLMDYTPKINISEEPLDEPIFYTPSLIRQKIYLPEEYIPTQISQIDKKIRGLEKGAITCLSGLPSSGKSTLLSELICNFIDQKYRVAIFSGEMGERKVMKWLSLQAAGKNYIQSTQYENYYVVDDTAQKQIDDWCEQKLYIYNNNYGYKFDRLMSHFADCVKKNKVDIIMIDNMMCLQIDMLDKDLLRQQSMFVNWLKQFAAANNIHVIFAAHPKKQNGVIRREDISGTMDIVNRSDSIIFTHRINEDFKRLAVSFLNWRSNDERFECSNLLEVNKVRDGIANDTWIKMYFEPESKRLKESQYENKIYGWQKSDILDDLPM